MEFISRELHVGTEYANFAYYHSHYKRCPDKQNKDLKAATKVRAMTRFSAQPLCCIHVHSEPSSGAGDPVIPLQN
jgi:hypothetical protein